jgi:CRISPR/Cas system CSM-associated protein Csm2 small subunit
MIQSIRRALKLLWFKIRGEKAFEDENKIRYETSLILDKVNNENSLQEFLENEANSLYLQVDERLANLQINEDLWKEALSLVRRVRTDLFNQNLRQLKVGVERLRLVLAQLEELAAQDGKKSDT